jgi:hypothetical protein
VERARPDFAYGMQGPDPLQDAKTPGAQEFAAYLRWGSGRLVHEDHMEAVACEERGCHTPGRTRPDDENIAISNFGFTNSDFTGLPIPLPKGER